VGEALERVFIFCWSIPIPTIRSRRGPLRQNKSNSRQTKVMDVAVRSVIRPYKADNILNFSIRYQQQGVGAYVPVSITRAMVLSTLLVYSGVGTNNFRVCAAVRVNRIRLTTANLASIEWLSAYGPTSATVVTGTSPTSPGELTQRPPKNSLCEMWSMGGSNESEILFQVYLSFQDYIDVDYSVVLLDQESSVTITTIAPGTTGNLYRTYLNGPNAAGTSLFFPVYLRAIN